MIQCIHRTQGIGRFPYPYSPYFSSPFPLYSHPQAKEAGPAISLSFLFCGLACIFTSLSYSEFAARVPAAGSAYTFVYASFGEFAAWLVGWNLTLGYGVSAAVIARSWAEYLSNFISDSGQEVSEPSPALAGTVAAGEAAGRVPAAAGGALAGASTTTWA